MIVKPGTKPDSRRSHSELATIMADSSSASSAPSEPTLQAQRWEAAANALRIALSDAIRPLEHSADIQQHAAKLIAEHFDANRVHFAIIHPEDRSAVVQQEYAPGLLSSVGKHPVSRYGMVGQQGAERIIVISDVAADPRLSAKQKSGYETLCVASMVRIRRIRQERTARVLVVADSRTRQWNDAELALLDEAGERVWAAIERAEAEEALHKANAQLVENDRRKDEFLAMLSHELRNPLAALQNAVKLLEGADSETQRERYMAILQRQSRTLGQLVDDLLDVSRITRGTVKLNRKAVDLSAIAARTADSIRPLVEQNHQTLDVELPEQAVIVSGDPMRLEQVLVNLLTNAAKYTEAGGKITLTLRARDGFAEVRVRDTGIGIAAQEQERIFTLFGQAEAGHYLSRGGLGIGLTVAKALMKLHDGRIEVFSDGAGKGSQFTVAVPLASRMAAPESVAVQRPAAPSQHKRVLLVEDMADVAETLTLLLHEAGHEVVAVRDGAAALEQAQRFIPDLVLLDIGLPVMDGYEVARRLRMNPRMAAAKLVALTGYGRQSDREQAEAAGFDAHFVKPVNFERLQRFINELSDPVRENNAEPAS